jgi:hypothetical protein
MDMAVMLGDTASVPQADFHAGAYFGKSDVLVPNFLIVVE